MKSLNRVELIGHLGKDPELRHTQAGQAVTSFSLATSEGWTDKSTGELKERTEWHTVVCWARLAEIAAQYTKKGSRVYVEGRIQSRDFEDRDGQKRKAFEIVANEIMLLDSKPSNGQQEGRPSRPSTPPPPPPAAQADDDVPF